MRQLISSAEIWKGSIMAPRVREEVGVRVQSGYTECSMRPEPGALKSIEAELVGALRRESSASLADKIKSVG